MTAACRFGPVVMPPLERLSVRGGYRLLWVAGDAADSHLLGSKVARLAADEQRSWQELERAAELAPEDPVVWFINQGGNRNRWIDIVPQPDANPEQFPDLRINMHAVGSRVELRVGPLCQSRVVSRLPVHFGLG